MNEFLVPYSVATVGSIALKLLLAFALGIVISVVYHWTHLGITERSFTDTLIILCMLISVVMVVIGDSVARAFSLVGALSIIRFRTVVQDPRDIAFVFFALATGMAVGASDPPIAILGTFLIGGIIILLHWWHGRHPYRDTYQLNFKAPLACASEPTIRTIFDRYLVHERLIHQETSKTGGIELRYHVSFKNSEGWEPFFQELTALEEIQGVKLTKQ
ncbi:MAG: DUF4956 domain-containing protein [Candidatus Poribacteria bacterium]|nr:DUF4956 domain-containing protein [Candidatus Poribacteria bacterium]MDE0504340.1 DUF4956 domain-containing protein [Candidatus Poribacteria bacterium]